MTEKNKQLCQRNKRGIAHTYLLDLFQAIPSREPIRLPSTCAICYTFRRYLHRTLFRCALIALMERNGSVGPCSLFFLENRMSQTRCVNTMHFFWVGNLYFKQNSDYCLFLSDIGSGLCPIFLPGSCRAIISRLGTSKKFTTIHNTAIRAWVDYNR